MRHLPTVRQLRYFSALVEHRHFRRAAETCFVSQSAFSVAIQEFESLLEVRLVDRTNRRVTITRVGQDVAVQARLCLRDLEDLVEVARSEREPLAGSLHLGVIPTIAPFLLPRLLPRLRRALSKAEALSPRGHQRPHPRRSHGGPPGPPSPRLPLRASAAPRRCPCFEMLSGSPAAKGPAWSTRSRRA